jgi:hypothetical protein
LHPKMGANGTSLWIKSCRTRTQATSKLPKFDNIFSNIEAEAKYEVYQRPAPLAAAAVADKMQMLIWAEETKAAMQYEKDLEIAKVQTLGMMLQCMSQASIDRVEDTEEGRTAIEEKDPLKLIKAIRETHMRTKVDDDINLYEAKKKFDNSAQGSTESLANFKTRKLNELKAVEVAAKSAESEGDVPSASMQVQTVLNLMNGEYALWKMLVKRGVMKKPATLEDLFQDAVEFGPDSDQNNRETFGMNNNQHWQVLVNRPKGALKCNKCGKAGHSHWHCGKVCLNCGKENHIAKYCTQPKKKSDDEIREAIANLKNAKPAAGGGKA